MPTGAGGFWLSGITAVLVRRRPKLPVGRGGGTTNPLGGGGILLAVEDVTAENPGFGGGGNSPFYGGAGTVLYLLSYCLG